MFTQKTVCYQPQIPLSPLFLNSIISVALEESAVPFAPLLPIQFYHFPDSVSTSQIWGTHESIVKILKPPEIPKVTLSMPLFIPCLKGGDISCICLIILDLKSSLQIHYLSALMVK